MASFITAGNATNGLQVSSDNTGILELKSGTGSGTTAVTFSTGQRATFPSTISVGNTTPATTGAGITFPAAQSASSDANTLDDYEEGTWTPTIVPNVGTITSQTGSGQYVKIGKQVTVTFRADISGGTVSSVNSISGLPFAAADVTALSVGAMRETNTTGLMWELVMIRNSTSFNMWTYNNQTTASNTYGWQGSVTYLTA